MSAAFPTLKIEGGLLASDLIERIASGMECGQQPSDFGLDSRTRLNDEIADAWTDARDLWHTFKRRLEKLSKDDPTTTVTRDFWVIPLLSLLGYELSFMARAAEVDGMTFAISHRAGKDEIAPPIHVIGSKQSLDQRPESGRPRLAAHALLQEYLNRTEHVWGVVTNGKVLRLLRDSQRVRRQAYIEFDLAQMMEGEKYADFMLLFRLAHRTRLPSATDALHECLLESYFSMTIEQGGRVRDRLRDGVEEALKILGNGFLDHPSNHILRDEIAQKKLSPREFYRQLLRLIYRLLFLMVTEERKIISTNRTYLEYYSLERVRRLLDNRGSYNSYEDLWLGFKTAFLLYQDERFGAGLQVPTLNGDLFNDANIRALADSTLRNRDLLSSLWCLAMYREDEESPWRRINYGGLDVEELGSVYESLLEFHPIVREKEGHLIFELITGKERKTTGSYYTPQELVRELIKSTLVPVMEDRLKKTPSKEQALLSISVLDPACGSGHFLLAAARILGKELAKIRTGEDEPTPENFRLAIRDVIMHCIYGVDRNPLAVDLCRVGLWIEGHAAGKPLTFLDHRIRCGDSLVGVFDLGVLKEGIPDDAFDPVIGDHKDIAKLLKKRNKQGQIGFRPLVFEKAAELTALDESLRTVIDAPEDSPADIRKKAETYLRIHGPGTRLSRDVTSADLWTAAFFTELTPENEREHRIPTSETLNEYLESGLTDARTIAYANVLAQPFKYSFFHWPLEFPDVFKRGGFDVIIGNPPWEILELEEQEYFSNRDPIISEAANKAERSKLIGQLKDNNPDLWREYQGDLHGVDALRKYLRSCGRFPLTSRGRTNSYAVFSELASRLNNDKGRAGIVVPTGIATDDTNKYFFAHLVNQKKLASLYDFENRNAIFPGVHRSYKFCLLALSNTPVPKSDFAFFLTRAEDLSDGRRRFNLTGEDFNRLNPNTKTCPIFRTKTDAELTKKIYEHVPVLINEQTRENPWGISFKQGLFNMSSDSHLFRTKEQLTKEGFKLWGNRFIKGEGQWLPLYEAKMIWQFDHRFGSYEGVTTRSNTHLPTPTPEQYADPSHVVQPCYWVQAEEVSKCLEFRDKQDNLVWKWGYRWFLGFRNIARSTDERTSIISLIPRSGVGHSAPLIFFKETVTTEHILCLLSSLASIPSDYCVRQKLGGVNMTFNYVKQFPVLPPDRYSRERLLTIVPKALELAYTSWDIKAFADDLWQQALDDMRLAISRQWEENKSRIRRLNKKTPDWVESVSGGIPTAPFSWDESRRTVLRTELDAIFAKLYGLTREELLYVLDPTDIYGPDFPGETFRVLKEKEIRLYNEYRTKRLVLEAWDKREEGTL